VHSRLGSAALVMQVTSSHRSGSKSKASKVHAAEASSSGNAFDDTVEHSHKKKEKRKFRLKRSKQRSVSSSPARKVMIPSPCYIQIRMQVTMGQVMLVSCVLSRPMIIIICVTITLLLCQILGLFCSYNSHSFQMIYQTHVWVYTHLSV
jgi:hypothetical protein